MIGILESAPVVVAGAPTVDDIRTGLLRVLGEDELATLWAASCTRLGVPAETRALSEDQVDRLLGMVAQHDRLCHVMAMSWRIRSTAARKLAALGR